MINFQVMIESEILVNFSWYVTEQDLSDISHYKVHY